jgi:hypothetical protein
MLSSMMAVGRGEGSGESGERRVGEGRGGRGERGKGRELGKGEKEVIQVHT